MGQLPPMQQLLDLSPVIPVLVIDRARDAVPLANALLEGGLRVLEVTLRTPAALEVIRQIAGALPQAVVGAGTVLNAAQLCAARDAGAAFAVSPGLTPALAAASRDIGLPLLPGVQTASEVMAAREAGFACLKFFPAQPAGGVPMLKALAGPFPELRFCPTGGITLASAPDFLALPNVACVGGTWLTPREAVAAGDWAAITALARQAAGLAGRATGRTAC